MPITLVIQLTCKLVNIKYVFRILLLTMVYLFLFLYELQQQLGHRALILLKAVRVNLEQLPSGGGETLRNDSHTSFANG